MNLILVSGRYAEPETHRDADFEFARGLAAAGCNVRLIVPVASRSTARQTETPPRVDGVRMLEVVSVAPPFRAVQGRLADPPTESCLARQIREELPDVVHAIGCGGAASANIAWVADRMGVPSIVSLESAPVICHRGDLIHGSGERCVEWNSARRCTACCQLPTPGGLGSIGAACARMLGAMRWPLHPWPKTVDFMNRRELVLGGLQWARRIVVQNEAERQQLVAFGARPDQLVVAAEDALGPGNRASDTAYWLELYRSVAASAGNGNAAPEGGS